MTDMKGTRAPTLGTCLGLVALTAALALPAIAQAGSGGVTAAQVRRLLADTLGKSDREYTLWNIQPGLGTVMIEYGRRMAMAYQAAQAGSWGMAQYQLKEATEIQEVGEVTRPGKAELLKGFEEEFLDPLAEDILAKDRAAFNRDFADAVGGCNSCHQATGHGYVRFVQPAGSPQPFLALAAGEPRAPEEKHPKKAKQPAGGGELTWAELDAMVKAAFNSPDRGLALWAIQPGLGTVMMEYGRRFAAMNQAVEAGSWGMAQYQLMEATEIQEVGEVTRPGKADLLKGFERTYLDPLARDIAAKDLAGYRKDLGDAIEGCNGCHETTGHAYVVVRKPRALPPELTMLALGPSEPVAKEAHPALAAKAASYPAGKPTLADAQQMIADRLNHADRSLALWAIQPGLGTVMQEYGYRFAMLPFAVKAGNWGMASYQLKEATEIQEVGEVTRPGKADLLKGFEHTYLAPLARDLKARDAKAFAKDYADAIVGCNGCHETTGHAYVVVRQPAGAPADFLGLGD